MPRIHKTSPAAPSGAPTILLDPEDASHAASGLPSAPKREQVTDPDAAKRLLAFDAEPGHWITPTGSKYALEPFSSSREALWLALRAATGAPALGWALVDGEAFLADAQRILWICSHKPEDWRGLRMEPGLMQERIDEWADKWVPRSLNGQAANVAMKLYNESQINRHEPAPPETKTNETDLGN